MQTPKISTTSPPSRPLDLARRIMLGAESAAMLQRLCQENLGQVWSGQCF
jgi:hypothetical protein